MQCSKCKNWYRPDEKHVCDGYTNSELAAQLEVAAASLNEAGLCREAVACFTAAARIAALHVPRRLDKKCDRCHHPLVPSTNRPGEFEGWCNNCQDYGAPVKALSPNGS